MCAGACLERRGRKGKCVVIEVWVPRVTQMVGIHDFLVGFKRTGSLVRHKHT